MKSFYLRWFFVAVAAILCGAAAQGQTIVKGKITDAASNAPVIGATVTAAVSKQATYTKLGLSFKPAYPMMAPITPLF